MKEELDALWDREWGDTPPIGHDLRGVQRARWVRFHSLPESKRYPDSEEEYAILLSRHHEVLDHLGLRGRCFVLAMRYFNDLMPAENPTLPAASLWRTVADVDDDLDAAVFAAEMSYPSPEFDAVLRAVADEREVGVIVVPPTGKWLFHPYDGGGDVIASTPEHRNELAARFSEWLSPHPLGL